MPVPPAARRRTSYRRAVSLALAGAIGLSSPALAIVTSVRSGATYRGGRLVPSLVEASFA